MTKEFLRWIERLFRTTKDSAEAFQWTKVEHLPTPLAEKKLYVLGDDECEWAAAMTCPCGCGSPIHLSLAPDSRPSWRVRRHRQRHSQSFTLCLENRRLSEPFCALQGKNLLVPQRAFRTRVLRPVFRANKLASVP